LFQEQQEAMPLPVFQFTVTTYTPFLYAQGSSGRGRINLYASDGNRLYLIFGATGTNSWDSATKTGMAYGTDAEFDRYIDLLRNEKPIIVTVNPNPPVSFIVYASAEPVGEGEM
jgi:hypothetical protein